VHVFGHDATHVGPVPNLNSVDPAITGAISDLTTDLAAQNTLVVSTHDHSFDLHALAGHTVYVDTDGIRNAAYLITAASYDRRHRLVLDIADQTTVRGYVDESDFSKGFIYDISVGARATIPLTTEWSR